MKNIIFIHIILLCLMTKSNGDIENVVCEPECPKNSDCIQGEFQPLCICRAGFVNGTSDDTGHPGCLAICEPTCIDNRICIAPGTCGCPQGFIEVNYTCVPSSITVATVVTNELKSDDNEETSFKYLADVTETTEKLHVELKGLSEDLTTITPEHVTSKDSQGDQCNAQICGDNSYCFDTKKCACLPGFNKMSAEYGIIKCEKSEQGGMMQQYFYFALGFACIFLAMLALVFYFCNRQE